MDPETRDKLCGIEKLVQQLHTAVVGDTFGNTGLIQRQAKLEGKMKELDRKWWIGAGTCGAAGTLYALIRLFACVALIACLAGCQLLPSDSKRSQSMASAEAMNSEFWVTLRRVVETGAASTNSTADARETLSMQAGSGNAAGSDRAASGASSVSIPLGVKLGLLAAGIGALVWVGRILYNSSATARATFNAADSLMANRIRAIRNRAVQAISPEESARLNADIAELESDRGRLRNTNIA